LDLVRINKAGTVRVTRKLGRVWTLRPDKSEMAYQSISPL